MSEQELKPQVPGENDSAAGNEHTDPVESLGNMPADELIAELGDLDTSTLQHLAVFERSAQDREDVLAAIEAELTARESEGEQTTPPVAPPSPPAPAALLRTPAPGKSEPIHGTHRPVLTDKGWLVPEPEPKA